MEKIPLPALGEGIEKATIAAWNFRQGDYVEKDDDVLEVVTDKAVFNVSAPISGILKEILLDPGKEAKIGDVLALIEPQ